MSQFTPGTFQWLVAHDIRLAWRGATGALGGARAGTVVAVALVVCLLLHGLAWPAAQWLSPRLHGPDARIAPIAIVLACTFSWMLAQSLFGAARTLYLRGDLDLLLGSPLPPHHVFAAKAVGIAAGSFGSIALLTLPIANAGAALDRPAWLGIYPTLIALALIATSIGMALTILLFRLLGPRRARVWTQLTGAMIAGAFVLGAQAAAVLPLPMRERMTGWLAATPDAQPAGLLALAWLPIDAVRGDTAAAALLCTIAAAMFAAVTFLLGRQFAGMTAAAAGASADNSRDTGKPRRFKAGLAPNMRRKEWRLLVRDPGLFAQLSLQIIYTLPIGVVLLQNDTLPSVFALAPTIVVVAAQVSASLAWLTVSGEDAPELISTAPVTATAVSRAKLDAIALPVFAIIGLPLLALTLVSWKAAAMTALAAAAAGASTALLNFWHPMPGNRRGMLRRHSQSKVMALIEHGLALLWAVIIVLAMLSSWLALVPAGLVVLVLALMRRRT